MQFKTFFGPLCLSMFLVTSVPAQDLKPMPHESEAPEAPAVEASDTAAPPPPVSEAVSETTSNQGLKKSYWLMANGSPVGYKLEVKVNGNGVTSVRGNEPALDLTPHVKAGLNTITLSQIDSGSKGSGQLAVTVGPELTREPRGGNQTYIGLKENLVHFIRPAGNRGGNGEITLHFSIGETPNPALTQRYLLYSQGQISGHKILVGLNGSPLVDIAAPGAYCDLNPFLNPGKNDFTFASEKLEGFAFSAEERTKLENQSFEVGVAIVGPYDPATYNTPVNQLTNIVLRYSQPAGQEEAESAESLTLMAE